MAWKPSRAVAAVATTRRPVLVVDQPAQSGADRGMVVDDDEIQHRPRMLRRGRPGPSGAPQYRAALRPPRLDQSAPDGVADELHAVAHAELGEDVRAVALDRLLAQHELAGDLARRPRLGDELDDLHLARGERVVGRRLAAAGALDEVAHQRAHGARVQERLAAHRGPAGLDQVAVGDALEHVARRARAQRLEQVLLVVVHGEDQHAQAVAAVRELARGLQPGHARHRDVQDGEVDVVLQAALDGLGAVADLRHDAQVGLAFEDETQAAADDRVVVGEHDPGGCVHGRGAPG